mgnify:FL=1
MASFRYKAVNESGDVVCGMLVADNPMDARRQLRSMELFPQKVEPAQSGGAGLPAVLPGAGARAAQHVTIFTRQFAVLLASGVPIAEALDVLSRQVEHKGLSRALLEAREAVNSGLSLAEALGNYPRFFDRAYIEMVTSAEKSGMMDVVFRRLAEFLERRRMLRSQVATALIYPSILIVMAVALIIFLSAVVVPMLQPLLSQHQGGLPITSSMLFAASGFVRTYIWLAVPLAALLFLALSWARRTERGRIFLDRLVLRIPLIGKLMKKSLLGRFSMSFSTLLRTGVPALEALETLASLTPNEILRREIDQIRQAVVEGKDMSSQMRDSRLFPPMVGYMVAVGERSGNLEEVLEHVSESYDLEVEIASRRLLTVLEPVLVLIMAAVVGFIALSLMMTILELSNI